MNPQKSATAARWSARVLSGLILLFWGFFLVAHLLADELRPSTSADSAILASIVAALAGLALAWRWELAGAVTTLLAIAVCAALNWKVLVFPGTLIPLAALLFLTAWWISHRRWGHNEMGSQMQVTRHGLDAHPAERTRAEPAARAVDDDRHADSADST